jgi:hypothetical protein
MRRTSAPSVKNTPEPGARRFEKPAPDARAAPPEAHESLISRKTVAEVPLTGLSSTHAMSIDSFANPDAISRPSADDVRAWEIEFAAAARRPLEQRMKYAFIHTYKPVLDDAPFRSFASMRDYREWCQAHLPDWLGYGTV